MNQFQYAIAKACYEAYHACCDKDGIPPRDFDNLDYDRQRCWLAGAQAAVDKIQDIVGVGLI